MQLGSEESENDRFNHYLRKTYRKTASLIANTTKSVRSDRFRSDRLIQYENRSDLNQLTC